VHLVRSKANDWKARQVLNLYFKETTIQNAYHNASEQLEIILHLNDSVLIRKVFINIWKKININLFWSSVFSYTIYFKERSWPWSYGSSNYNCLCNQCL
jgi:hypothetical protein